MLRGVIGGPLEFALRCLYSNRSRDLTDISDQVSCEATRWGSPWKAGSASSSSDRSFTNGQFAFALRQAENGATVDEVCRKMGVSEPTFYRWKEQFVGRGVPEIRRLKQLEDGNNKLKMLDRSMLQDLLKRKRWGPPFAASSPVICRWPTASASVGPVRPPVSAARLSVTASAPTLSGTAHVAEGARCRTGALRLPTAAHPVATGGLGGESQAHLPALTGRRAVNPAQAAQAQTGLALPARAARDGRTKRGLGDGLHVRPPARWASGPDPDGRRLPYARGALAHTESQLPRLPGDQGPGRFGPAAGTTQEPSGGQWAGVRRPHARPVGVPEQGRDRLLPTGKPTDNAYIEAFNGRLRAECLNSSWFLSLADARERIEDWRCHYDEDRPHTAWAARRAEPSPTKLSKPQNLHRSLTTNRPNFTICEP